MPFNRRVRMTENAALLNSIEGAIKVTKILDLPELSLALLARIHRAKSGITIVAAADSIGISRQLLSDIEEAGKVPSPAKLGKIVRFYGSGFALGLDELKIVYKLPKD